MVEKCAECKHRDVMFKDVPCNACHDNSNFEPQEAESYCMCANCECAWKKDENDPRNRCYSCKFIFGKGMSNFIPRKERNVVWTHTADSRNSTFRKLAEQYYAEIDTARTFDTYRRGLFMRGLEMPRVNLHIDKVIFNGPATIIIWENGTKTIVKCSEKDIYDQEKGLAMAICKSLLGEKQFKKVFKDYIPKEEEISIEEVLERVNNADYWEARITEVRHKIEELREIASPEKTFATKDEDTNK